jgi:hypothetical protein
MRSSRQVKPGLMGEACISHQRDIRQSQFFAHEIFAIFEMTIDQRQNLVAFGGQRRVDLAIGFFQIEFVEAQHRDGGLMAILFPEQPLDHQGALETVGGDQLAAFRQMQHDGVGLRQE